MDPISAAPIFDFRIEQDRLNLITWRQSYKSAQKKLVFTNGVFDLLHAGHVQYLLQARNLGDGLILGLNSDNSVHQIKGPNRPIQPERDRATLLAALKPINAIAIFDEETPLNLITAIVPDILVKGGDYARDQIVGRDVVEAAGGTVQPLQFIPGRSSTSIIDRIIELYAKK